MKSKALFLPIAFSIAVFAGSSPAAPPTTGNNPESSIRAGSTSGLDGEDSLAPGALFELQDLVSNLEQYEVYREAYHQGHAYFLRGDNDLRIRYEDLFAKIVDIVNKDALPEETGRKFKDELRKIGAGARGLAKGKGKTTIERKQQSHVVEPGEDKEAEEPALGNDAAKKVAKALRNLNATLDKKSMDEVAIEIRSPILNRSQTRIEHLVRFAKDTKAISAGKATALGRKLVRIESAEDRAKGDQNVRDAERKRLLEEIGVLAYELTSELSK